MRTADDPLIGQILADRYAIEACIGEGGMGRVYRAHHKLMGRRFAIKVLFGDWTTNDTVVSRFAREAAAAGRLHHRSLVPVVDFGEARDGLLYLAMDYVDGDNLNHILEREGPLARDRVIRLMIQMCQGLAHAHGKGLVHRDFKTDNILVGRDDDGEHARITDFGIAMLTENADNESRLTTQGAVVGTPAYMAPEQATGDPMDHRTDLFSLGLVLYEMLSGVLPFEGSPMGILRCNMAVAPPAISERVPGLAVDPALEALAMDLMAKDPDDRPSDANVVIARLEALPGEWRPTTSQLAALVAPRASRTAKKRAPATGPGPGSGSGSGELAFQPTMAEQAAVTVDELGDMRPGQRSKSRRLGLLWPALVVALAALAAVLFLVLRPSGDDSRERKHAAGSAARQASPTSPTTQATPTTPTTIDTQATDVAARSTNATSSNATPDTAGTTPDTTPSDSSAGTNGQDPDAGKPDDKPDSKPDKSHHKSGSKPDKSHHKSGGKPDKNGRKSDKNGGTSGKDDTQVDDTTPEPQETITAKSLTARYTAVGNALEALHKSRGEDVSGALRKRYFAVPFTDAVSDPALRPIVDASLRRLERDIDRAMH